MEGRSQREIELEKEMSILKKKINGRYEEINYLLDKIEDKKSLIDSHEQRGVGHFVLDNDPALMSFSELVKLQEEVIEEVNLSRKLKEDLDILVKKYDELKEEKRISTESLDKPTPSSFRK